MAELRYPPLLGYTNQLSARPGEKVEVKVSSSIPGAYKASMVRIISADPNPNGQGVVEEEIESAFAGLYQARFQDFHPGSYMLSKIPTSLNIPESFYVSAKIWPTRVNGDPQSVVSIGSNSEGSVFQMGIDHNGCPETIITVDGGTQINLALPVEIQERQWATIWAGYNLKSQTISVGFESAYYKNSNSQSLSDGLKPKTLAADSIIVAGAVGPEVSHHFNGKIEIPQIFSNEIPNEDLKEHEEIIKLPVFASWDFSLSISTTVAQDTGPHNLTGQLVNYPSRAMTSSCWNGTEMAWVHDPKQYAAIHFHDDDIYDFSWETDFTITLPANLRSGVYGIKLNQDSYSDTIPLFVCPPKGSPSSKICYLASTLTYTIYGNHARPDYRKSWLEKIADWNAYPWNPAEFPHYGLSTYNFHTDRSGICHASYRRPLFNLRPGYITFGANSCSGLRHFQADSHLTAWMEHMGYEFDVVTDYELHNEGADVLSGYALVVTGSHPEYHTKATLDALQDYRDSGGKLVYLGGNGFYWRVAVHPENPALIEIRRAEGGIRAWAAEPGEYYNAFDGKYGGLWRRSGRPPQLLAGVGFSAQGQFYGSYYRRTKPSYSKFFAWMFEGIDDDLLGDFGFSGGGAAGFELDRYDQHLGSPKNAIVVASSENHNSTFVLVPEEHLTHLTNLPGVPSKDLIRADMTYFENDAGGAVFSTGSITFCGSLPTNNFDNNISKLLSNVFNRFLNR